MSGAHPSTANHVDPVRFRDRRDAGQRLADLLMRFHDQQPLVLAVPRGGVAVGFEIATRLDAVLDVVLTRKIGHPRCPELAIGAIADGAMIEAVIDEKLATRLGVPREQLEAEIDRQYKQLERRRALYFGRRPPIDVRNRTVIVVDDGLATGLTMRAALRAVRSRHAARIVLAVPVAHAGTLQTLRLEADEIACLAPLREFGTLSGCYDDFRTVDDEETIELLDRAAKERSSPPDAQRSQR